MRYKCLLCSSDFCSTRVEDEPSVCYPCGKKRLVEQTFKCPLCQKLFLREREYDPYFFGKTVCKQCSSNAYQLKRLAVRGNARAQHLWNIAIRIVRPVYKKDLMIPVAIYYAESMWGNRWVGPPGGSLNYALGPDRRESYFGRSAKT